MINGKLKRKSMMVEVNYWEKAKRKAGLIPMSALIRRLLEMYVKGDIELEDRIRGA